MRNLIFIFLATSYINCSTNLICHQFVFFGDPIIINNKNSLKIKIGSYTQKINHNKNFKLNCDEWEVLKNPEFKNKRKDFEISLKDGHAILKNFEFYFEDSTIAVVDNIDYLEKKGEAILFYKVFKNGNTYLVGKGPNNIFKSKVKFNNQSLVDFKNSKYISRIDKY